MTYQRIKLLALLAVFSLGYMTAFVHAEDIVSNKQIENAVKRGHAVERHAGKDLAYLIERNLAFASSFKNSTDLHKAAGSLLNRSARSDFQQWIQDGCQRREVFSGATGVKGYGISSSEAKKVILLDEDIEAKTEEVKKADTSTKNKKEKELEEVQEVREKLVKKIMKADLSKGRIVVEMSGRGDCKNGFRIVTLYPQK